MKHIPTLRSRATLRFPNSAFTAFMAGRYAAMRWHWLSKARSGTEPDLRSMYVSFARSAHASYLKELKRFKHERAEEAERNMARALMTGRVTGLLEELRS